MNVDEARDSAEHQANHIELEDYAQELAFLPDLTETSVTILDYSAPNVQNVEFKGGQQKRLINVLKKHEQIMISSGNTLPPPAYGVVCDIDVKEHAPIKQRARRVALRHMPKLYKLLKGLLKAGLVSFSDSPWASPIVIVLKKNGVDIRLCIDYKMVNAVTTILEYAMPLVDDLLTGLESYLWFCSLDAASGFWAIMMTHRARNISAFVCALGHFEWLRMPFGLKNAPMIYQRMIDNALWGFVQPKGGWNHYAKLMHAAEEQATLLRGTNNEESLKLSAPETSPRTKFDADHEASSTMDPVARLVNSPIADMFSNGEPDESVLVPVFDRRSFVDDICFGGATFDDCLATLDRLLSRFAECRISVSFTKSIFVQSKVDFLSHAVSPAGIQADPKKLAAITELSFPRSKKGMQSFLGALNYYSRFIQDFAVYGATLYQLKDTDFGPGGDLSTAKRSFAALKQKVADAPILRHFDRSKSVHVMLFANEWALSTTLMQEHEGKLHPVRFCGRVLKEAEMNYLPAEKEVLALLLLLKMCHTQLAGQTLHVYTRFSTLDWVHRSKSLFGRAVQFSVLLSPWHLKVQRVKEKDCVFAQLLQSTITNFVDLEESLALVAPPTNGP
ncbi:Retrovirus-related Pol polyprotein from transposon 17.6 [Phytophthora ramorum]|uniref:Retrovirus-related Pol polyprotein from transposon 17.6 n=1 Tax=Phytophthora ramorum TaxID=164328 RepID=UPI003094B6E5|nr:Retrovirus-related Pol polyprotein from transposon 17.6 [Phytophthora ramorum]